MELKDWKDIERTAEEQIRVAKGQIVISQILLEAAIEEIHKKGGKTNKEEDDEHKATITARKKR